GAGGSGCDPGRRPRPLGADRHRQTLADPPPLGAGGQRQRHQFSADGNTLYIVGSHDANAVRLVAVEVATGKETVMAEDPQYDVVGVVIHPTTRVIQAVAFYKDKLEWQVLDPSIAADFAALAQLHKGEFSIIDRFLPPGLAGLGRRDLAD